MHVLITDLHKDRPAVREQTARHRQPVTKVGQIRVNPITPGIAKRLHLLRLACDVLDVPVLHIAIGRAPLEVGVELNTVGRVEVNALRLAP